MLRWLINAITAKPFYKGRSPAWSRERAAWIASHGQCEACGGTEDLAVHHIEPFHVNPKRELDRTNFITLCESATHNCHLIWGHFLSWSRWNPNVQADAAEYRSGLEASKNGG